MSNTDKPADVTRGEIHELVFRDPETVFNFPPLEQTRTAYRHADPFPHLIIDDFLAPDIADAAIRSLVHDVHTFNVHFTDDAQNKKTISTGDSVPEYLQVLASKYAAPYVLKYFEALTGFKSLIPDPYYNTEYGYYHMTAPGGILGSHVDHSHHQSLGIPHVLNVVLYLSPDWKDEDGGALHLFDRTGKKSVKRVPCLFNRAVVFACNPTAFHGVEPISDMAKRARHSLYFAYYWVEPNSVNEIEVHPGMRASDTDANIRHGTYFKMNWYQLLKPQNRRHLKGRFYDLAVLLTPPGVILLKRKLKALGRKSEAP